MEIPIVDIEGKEYGKVILIDEAVEILMTIGLSLMFNYDPKESKVIAYLY